MKFFLKQQKKINIFFGFSFC